MDRKNRLQNLLIMLYFYSMLKLMRADDNQTHIYAIPTSPFGGNESINVPCPTSQCYTLQEISETYNFTSNTTLVLLPGVHNITKNTSLDIECLEHIAIIGYTNSSSESRQVAPVIWCSNKLEFVINLQDITGVFLFGFEIHGCSRNVAILSKRDLTYYNNYYYYSVYDNVHYSIGIKITDSNNILLDNIKVYNITGAGLLLFQVYKNVRIVNSEFSYNSQGCCIVISKMDSETESSRSFDNNIEFGDIYIHLEIVNSVFNHNNELDIKDLERLGVKVAGVMYIHLITETVMGFETFLHNVTFTNQNIAKIIHIHLSSRMTPSNITIQQLVLLGSSTKNKQMSEYHCNGLRIAECGLVNTYVEDSYFKGYGSCVEVSREEIVNYLSHSECYHDEDDYYLHQNEENKYYQVLFHKTVFIDVQYLTVDFSNIDNVKFHDLQITNSSPLIHLMNSNITLFGNCSFQHNYLRYSLLVVYQSTLVIAIKSTIIFENNTCSTNYGKCATLQGIDNSYIKIFNSNVVFINNMATKSVLSLENSRFEVYGNSRIVFDSNSGDNGGALSLYALSQVVIDAIEYSEYSNSGEPLDELLINNHDQRVSIVFVNNHSLRKGGAIFVDDSSYYYPLTTALLNWFSDDYAYHGAHVNAEICFINNTADFAGSAIYGGWILYDPDVFKFVKSEEDLSVVSSNPVRVCLCKHKKNNTYWPRCDISEHRVVTYPGKTVSFEAVAVGQNYGTVPSIVNTELERNKFKSETILKKEEYVQLVNRQCTTLKFTFYSTNIVETMRLTVDKVNTPDLDLMRNDSDVEGSFKAELDTLSQEFTAVVTIKKCPPGFYLNVKTKNCTCHPILNDHEIYDCDINTLKVKRPSQKWINVTFFHNLKNDTGAGVIVNDHCPFDYCKQSSSNLRSLSLDMEHPDDQCDYNRSGILCGGCQTNFSNVFGTLKCKECPRFWTLLLVPISGIIGVLLIIAMLALNLTVSTGMLNNLVLYANIIRANNTTFFKSGSFVNYFIAWLNLNLGIEMCFYNGLDAYVKTWLQFIFPLYIWTIMIILIALSRRYVFVVRLCGSNVVQVLATLFLFSYAKLIRTIITIFQSTALVYPDGYKRRVWLYDGNVDYLKGKHIPLFIAGLIVLLCLSIPYTVSLLFIQWLRKYNHHRLLRWVGKLKPLFDAYTGPFKEKHCYWFGVLLLVRVALYLVFSSNISGDTSHNLMAIGTTSLCILSYIALVGGVYESTMANIADVSFVLNLGILTMGAHFYNNPQRMSTISVSIAFCQFVFIGFYHLYLRIIETRKGRQLNEKLHTKMKEMVMSRKVLRDYFSPPVKAHTNISHSSIELKEPLLVEVNNAHALKT